MGHSTNPNRYPTEYWKLLDLAALGGGFELSFATPGKAWYFQVRFGSFRKAVEFSPDSTSEQRIMAESISITRKNTIVRGHPIRVEPEVVRLVESLENDPELEQQVEENRKRWSGEA